MDINIIYEDSDMLVINKPAGLIMFPEGSMEVASAFSEATADQRKTLIELLLEKYPDLKNVGEAPRCGIVHRLDKDTSGVLLVAKTPEALIFLQKQFKNRGVEKKYVALATGVVKEDKGVIHTLLGRAKGDPRKQKAYPLENPKSQIPNPKQIPNSKSEIQNVTGKREAISEYKVLERFTEYTLLEVQIKTGRKHQIRCHLAYLRNPIAGDKLYGFKDSPIPEGLERQFLHAGYLKIQLPSGRMKEFNSDLPEDLSKVLKGLTKK